MYCCIYFLIWGSLQHVFYHNPIAIKLYESNGFEFIKREGDLLIYELGVIVKETLRNN